MAEVKFRENAETQEFQRVLHDAPRAMLPEGMPVPDRPAADPLGDVLTISDVARLLGCSVWTVRKKYLRRGLPFFRLDGAGKLVFYRTQITRWILDYQERHRGRR